MLRGKRSTRNTLGIFVVQFLVLGTGTLPMHSGFAVLLQNTAPLYRLQPTQPSHAFLFISFHFRSLRLHLHTLEWVKLPQNLDTKHKPQSKNKARSSSSTVNKEIQTNKMSLRNKSYLHRISLSLFGNYCWQCSCQVIFLAGFTIVCCFVLC